VARYSAAGRYFGESTQTVVDIESIVSGIASGIKMGRAIISCMYSLCAELGECEILREAAASSEFHRCAALMAPESSQSEMAEDDPRPMGRN
jgi:hypothetical protein